jgi:hypothetical protein
VARGEVGDSDDRLCHGNSPFMATPEPLEYGVLGIA